MRLEKEKRSYSGETTAFGTRGARVSEPLLNGTSGEGLLFGTSVFDWWISLQPPAHAGSSLADFSTLKMKAIYSSEMSVHVRSTWRHIPEAGFLHCSKYFSGGASRR
jgi:hypothetical protein